MLLLTRASALATTEPKRTIPPNRLAVLDPVIEQAIHDGNIPGAILLVGHDGHVIYRKAYGARALEPRREAMTVDTIFDLCGL